MSTVGNDRALLLSGAPGAGKSTIIKQALDEARPWAGGFFTEEIRTGGARQGFRLVTLDGESTVLAHIEIKGPHRVSKYGVDIGGLERVGVAAIEQAVRERDLVVIDEIGKMELFSTRFKEAVLEAMESGKRVLGTVMLASHPWADRIKERPDATVVNVTRGNREQVRSQVVRWLVSS